LRSDEIVVRLEAARFALDNEVQTHANAEQLERRRRRLEEGYKRWMTERRESEVALAAGLASPDVRVRIRSARVLARYRSPESLELLRESLRSGLSPESEVAALALGLRGDPDARIDLESASRLEHTPLAVAAIRALQDLGRSESLPLLRSIRQSDARDRVRTAAGYAVAMIETKPSP
jgi:HEAT repeat protein